MDNLRNKRDALQKYIEQNAEVRIPNSITAADVMTANPECLSTHATALDLVRRFHATGFRHLLLADEQSRLVGIISDRDVIRCYGVGSGPSAEELKRIRAVDLMSSDLITVDSSAPLDEVVNLMVDHGISSVPVLDEGRLVGILTNTDLFIVLQSILTTGRKQTDLGAMAAAFA
jgi:acetoin utilization protein AcuB